jgi:hypothetical protein
MVGTEATGVGSVSESALMLVTNSLSTGSVSIVGLVVASSESSMMAKLEPSELRADGPEFVDSTVDVFY